MNKLSKLRRVFPFLFSCILWAGQSLGQQSTFGFYLEHIAPHAHVIVIRLGKPLEGLFDSSDTLEADKKGMIYYPFKATSTGMAAFYYKDQLYQFYLAPGKFVSYNFSDSVPLIAGSAGRFARYFSVKYEVKRKIELDLEKSHPGYDSTQNLYTDQYFNISDSISIRQLGFLKSYFKDDNSPFSRFFIKDETNSIIYNNLFLKSIDNFNSNKFEKFAQKSGRKGQSFYRFSDLISFDRPELFLSSGYCQFMVGIAMDYAHKSVVASQMRFSISHYVQYGFEWTDRYFTASSCNKLMKSRFLNTILEEMRSDKKTTWVAPLDSIMNSSQNYFPPDCKLALQFKIDQVNNDRRFDAGVSAPAFELHDSAGRLYQLTDFRGKIIYIDLWAGWCIHCFELFPDWNRLAEHHKSDTGIVFISLNIDKNEKDWFRLERTKFTEGLKLYAGSGGSESRFGKAYLAGSVLPHFILIDRDGKFISYHAPSPDNLQGLDETSGGRIPSN